MERFQEPEKGKVYLPGPSKLAQETFLHVGIHYVSTLVCSISLLVNHTFRPQLCGQRRHNAQLTSSSCDSCTWPEQGLAEMLCVRFAQTLRFWGNYAVWHILGQTHMHAKHLRLLAQNMLPIVFLRPEVLIPHLGMNADSDHWAWNFDPQVAILLAASCFPRRLACLLLYLAFTDCTCLSYLHVLDI